MSLSAAARPSRPSTRWGDDGASAKAVTTALLWFRTTLAISAAPRASWVSQNGAVHQASSPGVRVPGGALQQGVALHPAAAQQPPWRQRQGERERARQVVVQRPGQVSVPGVACTDDRSRLHSGPSLIQAIWMGYLTAAATHLLRRGPLLGTSGTFRMALSAAIRICPLTATKKTPWPSQSVTRFASRCTATLPRTMLLCSSRGSDDISGGHSFSGLRGIAGVRTRQGWAAPDGARKLLLGHAQQVR